MNGPLATLPAILLWTTLGFAAGMLPFAVWLPRRFAGADVRRYGDGNPGAYNAWHAGGWQVGALVLLLDFFKGALPVGLAQFGAGQKRLDPGPDWAGPHPRARILALATRTRRQGRDGDIWRVDGACDALGADRPGRDPGALLRRSLI